MQVLDLPERGLDGNVVGVEEGAVVRSEYVFPKLKPKKTLTAIARRSICYNRFHSDHLDVPSGHFQLCFRHEALLDRVPHVLVDRNGVVVVASEVAVECDGPAEK